MNLIICSLLKAIESGLMEYWKKWSTTLNLDVCRINNNRRSDATNLKPIKLVEMSSAFLVLGIGMGIATISFIVEKIVWLFSKQQTRIRVLIFYYTHLKDFII